ncbi:MAG: methyltransferase domain-containing protein [Actinomycetota bacterium]
MTEPDVDDRERWNTRYRAGEDGSTPLLLGRSLHLFGRGGRALDVAGGTGQAAAILAARGFEVTVADVSDVALERAAERAERAGVTITTVQADLTSAPLPAGPWDLITSFNYLDRALFPAMIEALAPRGALAVTIATASNLERNDRPAARFLLDDGELPSLLGDLTLKHYVEGWDLNGRHTAEAIAVRL